MDHTDDRALETILGSPSLAVAQTSAGGVPGKAVMICGAGHSGSTLLGLILGSAAGAFYIGEGGKVRYLRDRSKPLRKRSCKICGENCELWGSFQWDRDRPLYPQIAFHVGAATIVDSTKDPAWIDARAHEVRSAGGAPHLLMLVRDGRAVVNSRLRKYPERDPQRQIADWVTQIEGSRKLFDRFDGPKLLVQYEQLASDPAPVVKRICELIGLEYASAMLAFHEADHHPLGGNNGTQSFVKRHRSAKGATPVITSGARSRDYYENHQPGIALDLRWKDELSARHAALFQRIAGPVNEAIKWE